MPDQIKPDSTVALASTSETINAVMEEISFRDSSYYPDSMIAPYNPDDIVQRDQTYDTYTDMLKDDQVSVCLQLKKDLILSSGFDIVSADESQNEIAAFIKTALSEDLDAPIEQILEEICSAYEYGFSVSEKLFALNKKGMLTLKNIKTRFQGSWLIHTDPKGNITQFEQRGVRGSVMVPAKNLIHYINSPKFQNPYGTSDLRAAYQAWFTKKHISRWYAIFIEKAASPIPVARYKSGVSETVITNVHNIIKKFQTKTAMTIPEEFMVEFLEAKNTGDAFIKGINLFNMFIGRSLLIPDLLGFQGSETSGGSYSLGKSQMEVFFKHIRRRREVLERLVNNEIVWPIVAYNFGMVDNYPKFKFKDITKDEVYDSAKLWLEAVKSPYYKPNKQELDHFRNIINFPIPEEEEMIEMPEDEKEGMKEDDGMMPEEEMPPKEIEIEILKTKDGGPIYSKSKIKAFKIEDGSFLKKTNYKLIENQLDTAHDSFMAIGNQAIDEVFSSFIESLEKKQIIERKKVDALDSVSLKFVGQLRQKLFKALKNLYKQSKEVAASEIIKGKFAKPIVNEAFLKILEAETFQYLGDWEYNVTKGARIALIQAIKDGKSMSSVVDIIKSDVKDKAKESLDRYSRTKFTEVMNKGRLAYFQESKVVNGYEYTAILDDRTSEICAGLDGKKFKAGDEPVPPMHFNCRSLLVPITIYEEFEPDTEAEGQPIDDFIEENLGAGFPKQ